MKTTATEAKIELKNILYLTDFSEPSMAALPFAVAVARQFGSKIHTLHVLIPEPLTYATPELGNIVMENQEECAKNSIRDIEPELSDVSHRCLVWRGLGVWGTVEQMLAEIPTDLIVVGTHGRTGAKRLLLGSEAEEILRRSTVPVLTVGPLAAGKSDATPKFRRILYATDFSDTAAVGLPYAISFAQENQAQLILLHAIPGRKASDAAPAMETSVAEAMHALDELIPAGVSLPSKPESTVRFEKPDVAILNAAEQYAADLIVLGIRGDEGIPGGSTHLNNPVTHNVICFATCPVLTVRTR
jgi:nucleotide-binding universal stress UspA family protein